MKKTIPLKTTNRLAQYSALSIAIVGIVDANGEVVYMNIADVGPHNQTFSLDLDGGGTHDFFIRHAGSTNYNGILDILPENGGNAILGAANGGKYFPFALNNGDSINSSNAYWNSNYQYQTLNRFRCMYGSGDSYWCDVTDRFLGLRFDIGGNTHYGWARLDVDLSTLNWMIKDYAYESTPGAGITAGDGILGVNDDQLSKVKIIALNKTIALYNIQESTSYKLFSMSGQAVLDGKIENKSHVIEANSIASGIYIIELKGANSGAIFRKKIVL